MTLKYTKTPYNLNRNDCLIGKPPSASKTAVPAAKNQNYLRNWTYNGGSFMYSGPPLPAINPVDGSFYVINWASEAIVGNDREVVVAFLPWPYLAARSSPKINWAPDYTDTGSAFLTQLTQIGYNAVSSETTDWYTKAGAPYIFTEGIEDVDGTADKVNIVFTPSTTGEHTCSRIDYEDFLPAAVSVWETRPDDMGSPVTTQQIIAEADVAVGTVARGFETGDAGRTGTQPSLGHLVHYIGSPDWNIETEPTTDTIDMATRRCLFQHGHPIGYWTDQTTLQDMYGDFIATIQPRNIIQAVAGDDTDVTIYPSVVVAGAGTIKLTVTTDVDVYECTYTHSGTIGTPVLIQPSDFTGTIKAEAGEISTLLVEIKATAASEFLVHTVSLWEGPQLPN